MALNWVKPGHNSAAEYQVSGVPYATGSATKTTVDTTTPHKVRFPYVTRWVMITNTDDADGLRVGYTNNGVLSNPKPNYFIVPPNTSTDRLEVRCKELYFLADANTVGFTVAAGLTNAEEFPVVTGSQGFEGVG